MVFGFLIAFIIKMLKRRASKRFVLAESGQDDVEWDSTFDVDSNADKSYSNTNVNNTMLKSTNTLQVPSTGQSEGLK